MKRCLPYHRPAFTMSLVSGEPVCCVISAAPPPHPPGQFVPHSSNGTVLATGGDSRKVNLWILGQSTAPTVSLMLRCAGENESLQI